MIKSLAISSSRKPPTRVRQLINELCFNLPQSIRIPRGHLSTSDLMSVAHQKECSHIFVISSRNGNPSLLSCYKIQSSDRNNTMQWIFDWKIRSVRLKKDLKVKKSVNKTISYNFNFKDIPEELVKELDFFKTGNVTDDLSGNGLILEYLDPGFEFYPQIEYSKISPIISISEIIITDNHALKVENDPR